MPRRVFVLVALLGLWRAESAAQGAGQPPPLSFTLDQALQYALEHYPGVRAALEHVNASVANLAVSSSAYLPRFDALWQTSRATTNNVFGQLLPQSVIPALSGPVLPSTSMNGVWGSATGALISWEPADFGLRGAVVRESQAAVTRARADAGLTRLTVQYAVGQAFLVAVSAQQALTAAVADVQRREVLATTAHALADNQLRPGAEASRADAELAAARTRAIQARQALAVAQATLGQMLGVTAGPIEVNPGQVLRDAPSAATPAGSAAGHPLLESSQATVDAARAREDVLSKSDRPRLYLQSSVFARGSGANADGSVDGGGSGLGLERANWAAGVQVVVPNLFDFAALRARRAAASATTRAETARYDEAALTVTAQQRMADAVVDATRAIAQNTPVQLAAAQQSEAQARARYDAGLTGIVEVADAQSLLAAAEYQSAVARVDVWKALLAQAASRGSLDAFIGLARGAGVP
jgi:outer membrane protein